MVGRGRKLGFKISEVTREKISGKKPHNYKGFAKCDQGYIMIYKANHPLSKHNGYVYQHRLIMEKHLGRYLRPEERIHHLDCDKTNNIIENLHLFKNHTEHNDYHKFLRECVQSITLKIRGE